MDKTLRSILWILIILVVLSSISAGWFFVAKERLYDEYVNLEVLFKTSMERLNRELASSNKENIELGSRLQAVERELASLQSRNKDLKAQYEDLLREKGELDRELVRVKKGKFFLEGKLKEMESDGFVAGLLKEKTLLEVGLKRLQDSLVPKDLEIGRLREDVAGLNLMLSKTSEEKDLLGERIEDSTKVAEILSMDLLREKDRNKEKMQEFANIQIKNRVLETRISELEEANDRFNRVLVEKKDAELKISKMETDLEHKKHEIEKLKIALEYKSQDTRELRAEAYHAPEEVELPPIVLQREDHVVSEFSRSSIGKIEGPSALKGRIVTINREHDFAVIDLGREHGIDEGYRFDVYRDKTWIASIEVIQTREKIAAADIKDVEPGSRIEIDDTVIKR